MSLSPELREQLIIEHLPQVKQIALRIHKRLPVSIALDDLVSAGVIGLIAAIDRYESRSNVALKIYAQYRIRSAILDSLRGIDWYSRQRRTRMKLIEGAISALEQRSPMPADDEIAAELRLSAIEYGDWLAGNHELVARTAENAGAEDDRRDLFVDVAASSEQSPEQILARAELEQMVAEGMKTMPPLEQIVINSFYYEERTFSEIAKITDLSEQRVAHLRRQAIARLRSYLSRKSHDTASATTKSLLGSLPGSQKVPISRQINDGKPAVSSAPLRDAREEETDTGQSPLSLIKDPIVQILMAAASAFQELEAGRSWLLSPNVSLGNVAPVSLISSRPGRELVENELGLIEHGMF